MNKQGAPFEQLESENLNHLAKLRKVKSKNAILSRKVGYYRQKYQSVLSGEKLPKNTKKSVVQAALSGKFSDAQISMILSEKKRARSKLWSKSDYTMAGKIRQISPRALNLVRKQAVAYLPASTTVQAKFSWIHTIPGFIKPVITYFKMGE